MGGRWGSLAKLKKTWTKCKTKPKPGFARNSSGGDGDKGGCSNTVEARGTPTNSVLFHNFFSGMKGSQGVRGIVGNNRYPLF